MRKGKEMCGKKELGDGKEMEGRDGEETRGTGRMKRVREEEG